MNLRYRLIGDLDWITLFDLSTLIGEKGDTGDKGWAPALAVVADGSSRLVLQVSDWVGGQGAKPATGEYVGPTGLTSNIAEAVNIRGNDGEDSGDMLASVYDPNSVGGDAFDMANMAEATDQKIMTAAERTKLAAIETEATKNATDAHLLDRANHTGAQPISSVTDLQTALDERWTQIDLPATAFGKSLLNTDSASTARTLLGAQATLSTVTQAEAETGTASTVRGWSSLRVRQNVVAYAASKDNAALTGVPTAPTAALGTNTDQIATMAALQAAINDLINGAPGALDTIQELAAALGDDPNFATTITNALAGKAALEHAHAIADVTGLQAALNDRWTKTELPAGAVGVNILEADTAAAARAAMSAQVALSTVGQVEAETGTATDDRNWTAQRVRQAVAAYAAAISHSHAIADVTGLQTALDGKAASAHSHAIEDVTGLSATLNDKAAAVHDHTIANVTGLQTALDGKATAAHTHSIANVTGLQIALDAKADTSHSHAIANVTGLQTALDGKADTGHSHAISDVTGLQTALDAKALAANPVFTGQALVAVGAVGTPSIAFSGNTNTGIYRPGADRVGVAANGVLRLDVTTSGISVTGAVVASGDVTAFSDERLKSNIETIEDGLALVRRLRGVTFTKDDREGLGVIAQEVRQVLPQLVQENDDGILSVAYGNIVGVLIEAIKTLDQRVAELEALVS